MRGYLSVCPIRVFSEETKNKLKNNKILISKTPIKVLEGHSTLQNSTNGMMNLEADAIANGLSQTHNSNTDEKIGYGSVLLNVNYNPSHGLLGDGVESMIDRYGGTTGIAKQTGEFIRDTTTTQGINGANFANHSQGNIINKNAIKYINSKGAYEKGGFKNKVYFGDNIPTFAGFGSPVNTTEMKETVKDAGFIFIGNFTNKGDFVGERLGQNIGDNGNRGNNIMTNIEDMFDVGTYKNLVKLFEEKDPNIKGSGSPHSNYSCSDLSGAVCGAKK